MREDHHPPAIYVLENLRESSVTLACGETADIWLNTPGAHVRLIRKFYGGRQEAAILAHILMPYKIASWAFDRKCAAMFRRLPEIENFGRWVSSMKITDLLPIEDMSDEQIEYAMATLELAAKLYAERAEALKDVMHKRRLH
jgi:hypothetical protein